MNKNGKPGRCDIDPSHVGPIRVVRASELAVEVDQWFREHYVPGEYEYSVGSDDRASHEQRGEPYADIMSEELGCNEDVVRALDEHLPDESHRDIAQGAESFYDDTGLYEAIASVERRDRAEFEEYWFENRISFEWQDFCEAATHKRRFFGLKETLDKLVGDPQEYEIGEFSPIHTLPVSQKIYRARLLDDPKLSETVRKAPAAELGAPPRDRTRPGRMNVEFIPGFYAAFSPETAVAEIRPGIGEVVAIGEFELLKPLRVFDFTVFARMKGDDWRVASEHTRYEFVSKMEGEISKPILPNDKQREYIPTQIVAEYLGEYFGCEAVIYRSSMIKEHDKESRNIVLLNKGIAFEGEAASSLIFKSYETKEVRNISYDLEDDIPFF
jgi:hypothetical protein